MDLDNANGIQGRQCSYNYNIHLHCQHFYSNISYLLQPKLQCWGPWSSVLRNQCQKRRWLMEVRWGPRLQFASNATQPVISGILASHIPSSSAPSILLISSWWGDMWHLTLSPGFISIFHIRWLENCRWVATNFRKILGDEGHKSSFVGLVLQLLKLCQHYFWIILEGHVHELLGILCSSLAYFLNLPWRQYIKKYYKNIK